ncbi:hypothetical protein HY384_04135 [Candidatus Daviesbacteria bacterium]|nr:hypothetical protein [Candidatus Daviesbacteria bacterium]
MLEALLVILIILWFAGYLRVDAFPIPDLVLFNINGQPITLWNILILLVISSIIGVLPSPFREVAGVFLILWILSVLGILAFGGLSSMLVIAIIVGLVLYLVGFR